MAFGIDGKVALVTGANRGIGKVILETLLAKGAARVYAAVRKPASVKDLVDLYGDRVLSLELDLTKPETIAAAAESAGDVELVINNAGVLKTAGTLSEDALDALKFELEGNLYGMLRMAQAFAPVLKANGGGAFVQLNSVVSMKAFPQFATYSASKAAAYSLTQSLKWDLEAQGTAVVSVHPGPIATDMGDAAGLTDIAESPQLVADEIVSALADGRFHAFAGSLAKQIESAYQDFATGVVEANLSEA
jgi:NAD(P)-dependent dehydrogenase (short-subunit alcohol dehydrogenase family)